ncbi:hypothetical protein AWB67_07275 [Caballeronia terrestris]|uniref:Uncharacterized protein n=1 Tax=Caballeronia terrestris TaxID=1226301 RepID=A0A158L046_9BURK|nr:hypothetical protein [Caballeronia terrestris]SAL86768.1 hypothetical protein AWB67_07275 [Caballeronia terrestris]
MDSDAERLARMQRVIDRHLEEIERLQNRPTWLSAIGVIAIIVDLVASTVATALVDPLLPVALLRFHGPFPEPFGHPLC